jgi:hypothetical protein
MTDATTGTEAEPSAAIPAATVVLVRDGAPASRS